MNVFRRATAAGCFTRTFMRFTFPSSQTTITKGPGKRQDVHGRAYEQPDSAKARSFRSQGALVQQVSENAHANSLRNSRRRLPALVPAKLQRAAENQNRPQTVVRPLALLSTLLFLLDPVKDILRYFSILNFAHIFGMFIKFVCFVIHKKIVTVIIEPFQTV